jgi:lysophospholipase L1-like esterase
MISYLWCAVFALALTTCSCSAAVLPMSRPMMGVRVEAGTYRVEGKDVVVRQGAGLAVDAPEAVVTHGEEVTISDQQPAAYQGGTVLRQTLGPVDKGTRVAKAIDPASVIVMSDTDPAVVYVRDKDYALDPDWGGFCRINGGAIPKDSKVRVDYTVHRQRIDAVQVSADGLPSIKKGEPAAVCPRRPTADIGSNILAYIHVQFRTTAITADDIYPLPAEPITWRDFIKVGGREHLKRTLGLLAAGKPVTIVCWGDSVTAGGSSSTHDRCYVELLRARIKAAYPGSDIKVINAGIGGSSTESRRAGYEAEVLSYKPDLITVEYVNDCGLSAERIAQNYEEFTRLAREKLPEVEFIIITPHLVRPDWMHNHSASVDAMRKAARDNRCALADTDNIWRNLRRVGIPYTTLLANEINHPDDLGHEFFAATLMKLLSYGGK